LFSVEPSGRHDGASFHHVRSAVAVSSIDFCDVHRNILLIKHSTIAESIRSLSWCGKSGRRKRYMRTTWDSCMSVSGVSLEEKGGIAAPSGIPEERVCVPGLRVFV
jgi:hypothetical protein